MSKRVANSKAKSKARRRVKIGWKKRRLIAMLEQQEAALLTGKFEDAVIEKVREFRKRVAEMVPKKFMPKRKT